MRSFGRSPAVARRTAVLAGQCQRTKAGHRCAALATLALCSPKPHASPFCSSPPQVFVILFGVGEMDTEGIYSLRAFGDDGLPQETIIAFETEEDAQQ